MRFRKTKRCEGLGEDCELFFVFLVTTGASWQSPATWLVHGAVLRSRGGSSPCSPPRWWS